MPISPPTRRDYAVLATGIGLSLIAWLATYPWNIHGWMIGAPLGRDFVNFWMAPRLVLAGQGAVLVDLPVLGVLVPAALVVQALRLLGTDRAATPGRLAAEPVF